jgi:hypothetical protein
MARKQARPKPGETPNGISRRRAQHSIGRSVGASTKSGYKYNCVDEETGDNYWVSGPHKDGADKLYGGVVEIDEDARVEYWLRIRERPSLVHLRQYRAGVSTRTGGTTRQNDPRARRTR